MKKIQIAVFLTIIAWFTNLAHCQELDPDNIRNELQKIDWEAKVELSEVQYSTLKSSVDHNLLQCKIEDVVTLWKSKKDYDYFELLWWRIDDPNFRVVIIYLMKHGIDKGSAVIPDFSKQANRYSDSEKKERLQELQLADKLLTTIK